MKTLTATILFLTCFASVAFSQEAVPAQKEKEKPKATYQVGSAKVIVWENKSEKGTTWKNFQIEKVYKKDDQWKTTNTFDETELLQLKAAIDKAINEESVKAKTKIEDK